MELVINWCWLTRKIHQWNQRWIFCLSSAAYMKTCFRTTNDYWRVSVPNWGSYNNKRFIHAIIRLIFVANIAQKGPSKIFQFFNSKYHLYNKNLKFAFKTNIALTNLKQVACAERILTYNTCIKLSRYYWKITRASPNELSWHSIENECIYSLYYTTS